MKNKYLNLFKILIFLLFFPFLLSNTIEYNDNFAVRNILIIPFYNISKVKEFNHFSNIIYETVKLELNQYEKFNVVNNENILKQLKIMGIKKRLLKENEIKKIGIKNNADVVVYGLYKINNNYITLSIKAYDLVNEKNININEIKGSIGLDLFRIIDLSSIVFTKRMKQEIAMVENEKYKEKIQDIKEDLEIREMIFIKGNKFTMGHDKGFYNLRPEHEVLLNNFYISKYEVSQKEWEQIMGYNPSEYKHKLFPVHNINWYEAIEFCNKKSIIEGLKPFYIIDKNIEDKQNKNIFDKYKWTITVNDESNGYRLPTEAEWEYACGYNAIYEKKLIKEIEDQIKYKKMARSEKGYIHHVNTEIVEYLILNKVGYYQPNEKNIYNMTNNVFEWCWDWYDMKYFNENIKINPKGQIYGTKRIIKGNFKKKYFLKCLFSERKGQRPYVKEYIKFEIFQQSGVSNPGDNYARIRKYFIGFRVVRNTN